MNKQTDIRIITSMIEKCDRLIEISQNYSDEEIKANYLLSDSIQFEFEKLYEDSTRLSAELRVDNPDFHIDDLRGIRNRVAHNYESVSLKILIDTIRNNIPALRDTLFEFINR